MTTRRNILALGALGVLAPAPALAGDKYPSYTALYADPNLVEGIDYARRYKRHSQDQRYAFARTTIVAPHGGGIEPGTSELCLAVAGYHPASLALTPPAYDYWMFEGLRPANNDELHVTSTHCDDPVVRSLCAGSLSALGLHGCSPAQAGLPNGTSAVLVGGRDNRFKQYLLSELTAAGFQAVDAVNRESLNGTEPGNIINRTQTGAGGQLEITTPLRSAMFTVNTRARRKNTTTATFWNFVAAIRSAVAGLEAG